MFLWQLRGNAIIFLMQVSNYTITLVNILTSQAIRCIITSYVATDTVRQIHLLSRHVLNALNSDQGLCIAQRGFQLTSSPVYTLCRYWKWCTSYSSLDISCKCWNLKDTGSASHMPGDNRNQKFGCIWNDERVQRRKTMMKRRGSEWGKERISRRGRRTKHEDKRQVKRWQEQRGKNSNVKRLKLQGWKSRMSCVVREDRNVDEYFKRQTKDNDTLWHNAHAIRTA